MPRTSSLLVASALLLGAPVLLAACGRAPGNRFAPPPEASRGGPETSVAPEPPARRDPAALLARVAVIGASASDGFGTRAGLAEALAVLFGTAHPEPADCASASLFAGPEALGRRQVECALAADPTLVVAIDFLFWFGYGLIEEEAGRLALLERGLALLERFDCPVVVARFPDMSDAVGRMLMPGQMPDDETLRGLNERLEAWAAARAVPAYVLPLDRLLADMQAGRELSFGDATIASGATGPLIQRDRLHPTLEGELVMARFVLATVAQGGYAFDLPSHAEALGELEALAGAAR